MFRHYNEKYMQRFRGTNLAQTAAKTTTNEQYIILPSDFQQYCNLR